MKKHFCAHNDDAYLAQILQEKYFIFYIISDRNEELRRKMLQRSACVA